jgi:hypothetical protein
VRLIDYKIKDLLLGKSKIYSSYPEIIESYSESDLELLLDKLIKLNEQFKIVKMGNNFINSYKSEYDCILITMLFKTENLNVIKDCNRCMFKRSSDCWFLASQVMFGRYDNATKEDSDKT